MSWKKGTYEITTDPARADIEVIHGFLSTSYWAQGIPKDLVERSLRNSLSFCIFHGEAQVGFARVVTDKATFAYLADVFVLEGHRGKGLAKWLMQVIFEHPELQGFRRWLLGTRDAHALYGQFGFRALNNPSRFMEKHDPDVYRPVSSP